MPNPWFRLYSEFATDPKVQMMTEAMQRRLVMLLCSRCNEETLHETEMAFHWRCSDEDLSKTKALFIQKGFIDERWNLLNWNKRQFLSDSSTERVRKHRQAMKQDETLHETDETVTVTAPDTEQKQKQIRTEAEKTLALTSVEVRADRGKLLGTILLNKGDYEVRADDLARDGPLYPGVDVLAEYRAMKAWSIANPAKRKTAKGIARFMNQWLSRAQDEGGKHGTQNRISPAAERGIVTRSNISESFTRRHASVFGAYDGTGSGREAEPNARTDDGGHVRDGVGGDGFEVRAADVPGRVIEGVA